uniref:Vacuolar protein sorting-associated protein VTA1 homolog n=1 Tax=Schistocephalus solidus TaxID=70667 RepID=A0A0V0JA61_SCHSO
MLFLLRTGRMYAVQTGVKIDAKSKESSKFLSALLDNLDDMKKALKDDERISSELHGQAYIEEYALKLFAFAFKRDEAADFGPATIKSFLTAGILMDVLSFFGEVSEEIVKARKYAKYKAVYIKRCLDSGEVPVAGPASEEDASSLPDLSSLAKLTPEVKPTPPSNPPSSKEPSSGSPGKAGSSHAASPQETAKGGKELDPKISALAIKHAKYAISALDYDDRTTAIQNLQEALKYLTTQ